MEWLPINFQGLVDLDPKIIEQLDQYLQEKENRLAYQILNALHLETVASSAPALPIGSEMKLGDAIESFTKQVRNFSAEEVERNKGKKKIEQYSQQMNRALWDYTEVLEGVAVELFQQVKQVPVDRWHLSLLQGVDGIKDLLLHRIEDLMWAIRRLEKPFKEFCRKIQSGQKNWLSWFEGRNFHLDGNLLKNLNQTEKFLKSRYEAFRERYDQFILLSLQVEEFLEKMKSYSILSWLDLEDQNLYVDVFRLLKMLELNPHPKKQLGEETARALKQMSSIDHVLQVFKKYFMELRQSFFNISMELKFFNPEDGDYLADIRNLQKKTDEYRHELKQFLLTLRSFRTFILRNDSNPYVSSNLGFKEWIVGPEPAKAKQLANLIYEADELEGDFLHFSQALKREPAVQLQLEYQAHEEIDKLLHEMGQPLISRSMMKSRAEKLLEALKICDETVSPQLSTVFYFDDVLSKALRVDWKYHVLHEFPEFHKIYKLHKGLEESSSDPGHKFRISKFRDLFAQVEEWASKGDLYAHVHEIEVDMNDMKTYLQDFLATIQRAERDKAKESFREEKIDEFYSQLLEYRYLFGQFFSELMTKSTDCQHLRNQFLFVDQYFETMEKLLQSS